MPVTLNLLQCSEKLTKEYQLQTDGTVLKTSYPNVYNVTSIQEVAKDLKHCAELLRRHAAQGHCLIKGLLSRVLVNESRAGATDPNASTDWLLLDLDGVDFATPDDFMKAMGLAGLSYVVQYSASHHIFDKLLRCHIILFLDKPCSAPQLKEYLKHWNLVLPGLKSKLALTRTGTSLRYGLDITTCQSDKLIYIAPPILKGVKDPMAGKQRIEYVKRKTELFKLPPPPSLVVNKAEIEAHIATLRDEAKLPVRKNVYKHIHNTEVLSKPDQAFISGIKEARGFVYFNLNGGDSWAHYHPANNPDFIHNFKGEAVYLTKELLPEYWSQITQAAKASAPPPVVANAQGVMHLAFLDKRSSGYWRGTYDQPSDFLDIYTAKNETHIRHYAAANDIALGDFIPEWDISFDPNDNVRVDITNRTVNLFQPTKYMLAPAKKKPIPGVPPTILKVIKHAMGSDEDCLWQFINWVAYIAQFRSMTRTAWILHGTEGTGKGLLFHNILRKLFEESQTTLRSMNTLGEKYNSYMERSFIVMIDEVQTSTLRNEGGVLAKLRSYITEPNIPVRAMFMTEYEVPNYTNWIFSSNKPDPVSIPKGDRRFNVGKYQPDKLVITQAEIAQIEKELQDFYQFLMEYKVDEHKAHTPLDNEDRAALIEISTTSIDAVADAILLGDFDFLMAHLPTTQAQENLDRDIVDTYKATLIHLMQRTADSATGKCNISRDELYALFQYTVGEMPRSPNKFTSRLKHHRIHIKKVRIVDKTIQGINTQWKDTSKFPGYLTQLIGKPQLSLAKSSKSK